MHKLHIKDMSRIHTNKEHYYYELACHKLTEALAAFGKPFYFSTAYPYYLRDELVLVFQFETAPSLLLKHFMTTNPIFTQYFSFCVSNHHYRLYCNVESLC